MIVYHSPRSRSLRVLWALEEMGLSYETRPAAIFEPSDEFAAANPSVTAPTLVDDDGSVVIESGAILQYLGAKYGPTDLVVSPDEPGFADYLQFLWLGEAGLSAPLNALIGTKFFLPEDQRKNGTTGIIVQGFIKRMKLVEARLEAGHEFLAADRFTFADISVGWLLGLVDFLELGDKVSENARAYHARLTLRPAYKRAAERS
jgi:glutathione S-transferase